MVSRMSTVSPIVSVDYKQVRARALPTRTSPYCRQGSKTLMLGRGIRGGRGQGAEHSPHYPGAAKVHDNQGDLPLHYAMERENTRIITKLLRVYPESLSVRNKEGHTPLDLLLSKNCSSCQQLKESIVTITLQENQLHKKLESAVKRGNDLEMTLVETESQLQLANEKYEKLLQEQGLDFEENLAVKIKCLQAARNSESQLITVLAQENPIDRLKEILESLVQRCKDLKDVISSDAKQSITEIAASALLKDDKPSHDHLVETISTLNKELLELEASIIPSRNKSKSPDVSTLNALPQGAPESPPNDLSKQLFSTPLEKKKRAKKSGDHEQLTKIKGMIGEEKSIRKAMEKKRG